MKQNTVFHSGFNATFHSTLNQFFEALCQKETWKKGLVSANGMRSLLSWLSKQTEVKSL